MNVKERLQVRCGSCLMAVESSRPTALTLWVFIPLFSAYLDTVADTRFPARYAGRRYSGGSPRADWRKQLGKEIKRHARLVADGRMTNRMNINAVVNFALACMTLNNWINGAFDFALARKES